MGPPFEATLFRWTGPNAWTFVAIPEEHAPDFAGPWGRTAVCAEVDGRRWETSAWRDRRHGWLLPVPKRVRGGKEDGERVVVRLGPPGLRG